MTSPISEPAGELDARFSQPGAAATPWAEALAVIQEAPTFWISTVRADGRPHVTPLLAVWLDGVAYISTGAAEQKSRNLEHNPRVALTTGDSALDAGLDIVIEGEAVRVRDDADLLPVAEAYAAKYGEEWRYTVDDGAFVGAHGNRALVFAIRPQKVLGFAKGTYAQTRWRFGAAD